MKAAGHAFQPEINKHRRRQALGGGVDLQGGSDGGKVHTNGGGETDHANYISHRKNKLLHEMYRENEER